MILLYDSTHGGQLSTTKGILEEIRQKDFELNAQTPIVAIDLLRYANPLVRRYGAGARARFGKHLGWLDAYRWRKRMREGSRFATEETLSGADSIDLSALATELRAYRPKLILATSLDATEALIALRKKRSLPSGLPLAWVMTTFGDRHAYFMKLSQELDRTFLPHASSRERFEASGLVEPHRLEVSGIPVAALSRTTPADRAARKQAMIERLGWDSAVATILIAPDTDGWTKISPYIDSFERLTTQPLQILVVCGKNPIEFENLSARFRRQSATNRIRVHATQVVSPLEMRDFMATADVVVSNAGSLTPIEAIHSDRSLVLVPGSGGDSLDNTEFLTAQNLARIGVSPHATAAQTMSLLRDGDLAGSMRGARTAFLAQQNFGPIADYAHAANEHWSSVRAEYHERESPLGLTGGIGVGGATEVLADLERQVPGELEIFLAHSSAATARPISHWAENPFGHIAVRVGDAVYNVNHFSTKESNDPFLTRLSLEHFLFGVDPIYDRDWVGHTFGLAYDSDVDSVRVRGVPAAVLDEIRRKAAEIENRWERDQVRYQILKFNCADVVAELFEPLRAYLDCPTTHTEFAKMPKNVFSWIRACVSERNSLAVTPIRYTRVSDSRSFRKHSRPPISVTGWVDAAHHMASEVLGRSPPAPASNESLPDWIVESAPSGKTLILREQSPPAPDCPLALAQTTGSR